jgi:acetyltransferase
MTSTTFNTLGVNRSETAESTRSLLPYDRPLLAPFFAPKTVAVIGATEKPGSVGRTVLWNLISSPFGGTVFPVNPKWNQVLGIKAYPSVSAIPEPVELAVIAVPAAAVPGVVRDCVAAGIKAAIILSAGFKEIGTVGIQLEAEVLQIARDGNLRIIGPNCLGLMCPPSGLNATFAGRIARPGHVGFISQSGALCTSILDWSDRENVGFSAFISIGSMLDVNWGDLIDYLGDDPQTHSIVIYMESIGDARSFLSAAREVALSKPIIVLKAGRTAAAAQAAASHTGALTGSDDVLDAAFRRCGVLRVNRIDDLFNMAEVLAKQPRPKGKRLTILTNAGGPGVLATDALIREGGKLAPLATETIAALDAILPSHWSHQNPIDILGDATPERYAKALAIAAQDPHSDGLLVVLTPQAMTNPTQTAEQLKAIAPQMGGKPLLACWMGGQDVALGEALLNQAGIFTFPYPDTAAQVFNLMWRYSESLQGLYETPSLANPDPTHTEQARTLLHRIHQTDRTLLTESESKQLLAAYDIPTVPTHVATTEAEAEAIGDRLGYPVVLKLHSHTITHKTDVGGVKLNLGSARAVRDAYQQIQTAIASLAPSSASDFLGVTVQPMINREGYELILGSSPDPQFGPVLLFGTGGQLVEVFQDRALGLPPLNTTLARRMMEQTRIYTALQGVRGRKGVNLDALEQLLVRFSQLVVNHPEIREIDINPLLVDDHQIVALDARVVLYDRTTSPVPLPKPAIRPYPSQYITHSHTRQGLPITLRPIRPEDEPLLVQLHYTLSEESVYFRYFHLIKLQARIAHDRLTRICFIDYDREIALVAETTHPDTQERQILAVGRLSKRHGAQEAEFGLLVSDRYHHQGIGTQLLRCLVHIAQAEGLHRITAEILPENLAMQHLCQKVGFQLHRTPDVVQSSLDCHPDGNP